MNVVRDVTQLSGQNLVDFLIIGAAKSATTWLQNSLQKSPAVFMPDPELHYFSREYTRGSDWYAGHFHRSEATRLVGEKSNSYLTEPAAAQRIHDAFPDVRLVVQLRNPVARAYSDYCMLYRRGTVGSEIEEYLDPRKAANGRFIHDGMYAHHLRRFLDLFSREQLLVLLFEDVKTAPEQQLEKISRHIGLNDALPVPLETKVKDSTAGHVPRPLRKALKPIRPLLDPFRESGLMKSARSALARPYEYPKLPKDLAERLAQHYAPDIADLQEIAGRDLCDWAQAYNA